MEMTQETEISTELGVLSFDCETCQNSDQGAFHDPEEASGSSQWAFPGADRMRSLVETAQTAETMQGLQATMARSEERASPGCKFGDWRGMRGQRQSWEAAGCKILPEST